MARPPQSACRARRAARSACAPSWRPCFPWRSGPKPRPASRGPPGSGVVPLWVVSSNWNSASDTRALGPTAKRLLSMKVTPMAPSLPVVSTSLTSRVCPGAAGFAVVPCTTLATPLTILIRPISAARLGVDTQAAISNPANNGMRICNTSKRRFDVIAETRADAESGLTVLARIPAVQASVARAIALAALFAERARLPGKTTDSLVIIVEEWVMNIVEHGGADPQKSHRAALRTAGRGRAADDQRRGRRLRSAGRADGRAQRGAGRWRGDRPDPGLGADRRLSPARRPQSPGAELD